MPKGLKMEQKDDRSILLSWIAKEIAKFNGYDKVVSGGDVVFELLDNDIINFVEFETRCSVYCHLEDTLPDTITVSQLVDKLMYSAFPPTVFL